MPRRDVCGQIAPASTAQRANDTIPMSTCILGDASLTDPLRVDDPPWPPSVGAEVGFALPGSIRVKGELDSPINGTGVDGATEDSEGDKVTNRQDGSISG